MADKGNSSKTIALLLAIVAITVALFGTEAWNRSHKGQKLAVKPAAAVSAPVETARGKRVQPVNAPDPGTADFHGEVMHNE